MKNSPCSKAFTLIELLIVVAIIAILAAIAVPNFLEAQVRAKVSRAQTDMRSVATALEAYAVDHNQYPLMRMLITSGTLITNRQPDDYVAPPGTVGRVFNIATIPLNLTTPVAYITTTFRDPFISDSSRRLSAVSGAVTAGPGSTTPLTVRTDRTTYDYRYDNMVQLTQLAGFGFDDRDLQAYGRWRLTSIGPDNEYFGSIGRRVYDPTNGTTSLGDIVRTQLDPENKRGGEFLTSGSN
jgi:prepilin-type N-terminal cleavage/methylation domain-containing protein